MTLILSILIGVILGMIMLTIPIVNFVWVILVILMIVKSVQLLRAGDPWRR